jgi:hypothetical protein
MISPARFDRVHGKGAFARLRSMLADPTITYERIANKIGLTRQRIGQLANELGINGRQRERVRLSRREPRIIKKFKEYPSEIRAVMNKLRRAGLRVAPYNSPQPSMPNSLRTSLRMILVNGLLCMIQVRPALKFRPNGREYARLDVGRELRRAQVALFAIRTRSTMKLYVIPTSHLRKVSAVYIPADGKYAVGSSKKPRKDWTRYEDAWHLLSGLKVRTNSGSPRHEVHT